MLLRSIRLENIRSYTSNIIDFSKGSSLLYGDIGAGKTTVLLAIEFALFGLIKGDVSGSTLLRHGKSEGKVELAFSIDDKEYIIGRKLKRKNDAISQDAGYIISDNKKFDGTPVELKSKILELCGYPQDLINKNTSLIYRYTVYTPQEDMKAILFESKEDRLDTLRKIFNIDKYKRVRENALNYAKELRNTRKILETKIADLADNISELQIRKEKLSKLNSDKAVLDNSISEIHKDIVQRNSDLLAYEDKIKELSNLVKNLEIMIINMKNKKSELDRTLKDLNMVDYRIREYDNKLRELGVIDINEEELRAALADSEDKLTKINSLKETVNERLDNKNEDLKRIIIDDQASLNFRITSLAQRLETRNKFEKDLDDKYKESDKINSELNNLKISRNNSSKIIAQLEGLNTCPTCLQNVDFTHKIKITDRENAIVLDCDRKISEYGKKSVENQKIISDLKIELDNLRKDELTMKELTMKMQSIAERKSQKEQLEKEIEDLIRKKEKLDTYDVNKLLEIVSKNRKILTNIGVRKHIQESLTEKSREKKELEERKELLDDELKIFQVQTKEIDEKVRSFENVEKEYKDKKLAIETLKSKMNDLKMAQVSINKDLESNNNEIMKISESIENKKKIKSKINYLTELNYWINEHFINLTSLIERSILQKAHKEFDALFQQWFMILMDDDNLQVKIDEEFTPIIEQNNYQTFIENLSGGEKTAVALAYRLALNKVINDLINTIKTKDLIILDEPTDGFSSEQLDKMRDVFNELKIGQLIIVSHESKLESYVQNIIRINKTEHESKVMV